MENISKSIWQKIWETLKLIWQKTLIFTVIGFFTALFFSNADEKWIGAFISIPALLMLAVYCLVINTLTFSINKNCCLYNFLFKFNMLLCNEIRDAYFIVLTYLTGLWLGVYFRIDINEWKRIFSEVIVAGYFSLGAIYLIYNITDISTYLSNKLYKLCKPYANLKNDTNLQKFSKKFNIFLNGALLFFLIYYIINM